MPKPINLPIRKVLKAARKAFDAGKLQAQTATGWRSKCAYAGPCVIGVAVSPKTRAKWDDPVFTPKGDTGIESLHDLGRFTTDALGDLVALQKAHDNCVTSTEGCYKDALAEFVVVLTSLELRYAT